MVELDKSIGLRFIENLSLEREEVKDIQKNVLNASYKLSPVHLMTFCTTDPIGISL